MNGVNSLAHHGFIKTVRGSDERPLHGRAGDEAADEPAGAAANWL